MKSSSIANECCAISSEINKNDYEFVNLNSVLPVSVLRPALGHPITARTCPLHIQ